MNQKLKKQFVKTFAVLFSAATLLITTNSLTSHAVPPRKRPRIGIAALNKQLVKESFWDAVKNKNISEIERLIDITRGQTFDHNGNNLINTLNGNDTALTWAVKEHKLDLCEFLLNMGADVNQENSSGNTALMDASRLGFDDIITILFKYGADPNMQCGSFYGDTALMKALKWGKESTVELLLQNPNININQPNKFGRTALLFAINEVGKKKLHILEPLIENEKIGLTIPDDDGNTALHYAVKKKNKWLISLLSEKGIDVVNAQNKQGDTALIQATKAGQTDIVNALLHAKGIDVNAKDNNGNTALMWAAREGHTEIVNALLEVKGINVNEQDNNGNTALMWAAKYGKEEIINALVAQEGIDLNIRDGEYKTALVHAILNHEYKKYEIVYALENAGALGFNPDQEITDLPPEEQEKIFNELRKNAVALLFEGARTDNGSFIALAKVRQPQVRQFKNSYGQNALMVAAMNGSTKAGYLLLSYFGAISVNEKDIFGNTALIYAVKYNHPKFARLLKKEAINAGPLVSIETLKIKNNKGRDVDTYARRMGYRDFWDWLNNSPGQ